MDDPQNNSSQTNENKNALPDVVHSQQIPTVAVVNAEPESTENDTEDGLASGNSIHNVQDTSETESISEHLPSKSAESLSETDNVTNTHRSEDLLKVETDQEKMTKTNSLNIPVTHSPNSESPSIQDPSKQSTSWPIDVNAEADAHNISEESPVNLAVSSDFSRDVVSHENESLPLPQIDDIGSQESPMSDKYDDSLNDSVRKSLESESLKSLEQVSSSTNTKDDLPDAGSSGSEEIIKLDIRGQGAPKFSLPSAKIIFGPPPQGSTILDPDVEQIPVFQNLLSPFLVGGGDSFKVEEVFDFTEQPFKEPFLEKSPDVSLEKSNDISLEKSASSDKSEQKDLLVEEITVDEVIEKNNDEKNDEPSLSNQPRSMAPEETMSFSTMTTDYKTICEEYHTKLVHFEDALTQRDELIEELTISLQRSIRERDDLKAENDHLTNEVHQLQHVVGERSSSEHDTIKAQLSDFVKYQSMLKDDSTKFYSALMSGGSSLQSSNGEKDMEREEITVNYSRSDLKSSSSTDEFQTGFENKLNTIISKFEDSIEENLRNKLRESIIQVLCDEISKMRIDSDTEIKELETQMQQDRQTYTMETRKLRELLASVKAGTADIDALRQELCVKHEKEMENLRTYFEKKCTDMERSYSEDVWRGRTGAWSPGGSEWSLEADAAGDHPRRRARSHDLPSLTAEVSSYSDGGRAGAWSPGGSEWSLEADAAGDHPRRRARSHDLPSLTAEIAPLDQTPKQSCRKHEQQLEDLRAEHAAAISEMQERHVAKLAALEEQIIQLKAHIQSSEQPEANVSLYQQDIDLELEKDQRFQRRLDDVRQEVIQQLQEQIQVLLSDPDAEVSSWPLELVALRDKIQGDARTAHEKELSSLKDELSGGEDKWRQRRNLSFDQNRHLEEVTKERDGLKRVAVGLHRVVGQLVAYCARAEDELNRTVLAQLLARLAPDHDESFLLDVSRPSSPEGSVDLNTSAVSRRVHFAPELQFLGADAEAEAGADADEASVLRFLQQQRDLSADIKLELEKSLRRLRNEATSLLDLSAKLANSKYDSCMVFYTKVDEAEAGADADETSVLRFLQQQRDLSADIKLELEKSLRRIRNEATSLLDLSAKLANSKYGSCMVFYTKVDEAGAGADADVTSVLRFLQQQRHLSAEIKLELEKSLRRLRNKATSLLNLSAKLANKRHDSKMLESSQVQITELVHDFDSKQRSCDSCELHRKNMEEAMAECLQRESLLRSDLEAAMIKIAQLMTVGDRLNSSDLIAEGYGTGQSVGGAPRGRGPTGAGSVSLDGAGSPRGELQALARELEMLQRDRDDLHQQLEAANRQLRSTRQFVEEQANEREQERDEFARRLQELRDDNQRLTARLQNNARILNEVEQLEAQTRDMNQIIADLESRKASLDEELKARDEKIALLRDIIANLESQLEQKSTHETEIVEQLEVMKQTIDDRDSKMRSLLGELESLRSEKAELSHVVCVNCAQEDGNQNDLLEKVKEQCRWLEERIHRRTQRLERMHEVCSTSCSEPSEDVSLRDQKEPPQAKSPASEDSPRPARLVELVGVWECLQAHARAEDAALKRVQDLEMQRAQLKDVAQEVRAERDVLQARMSEQALKISSLSARLQQQRNDAEALAHHASSQLSVQLHDARAEVEKLKEDLESKDKQLLRLKQTLEERDKSNEQHQSLYGNSCNPKDKVVILERELSSAQTRIAQLETLAKSLEADKDALNASVRDLQRALAEREEQLQELLALKLDDDNQQDRSENLEGVKTSARTLSDIVSISEFDEQDLQMRRAELRGHNTSLQPPHSTHATLDKLQRTLPPDMSSLHIEYIDHSDLPHCSPRADSLPAHLTSTQNREPLRPYKRNVNETTFFGIETKQTIPDNCSMYPNRDISDSKNVSVEPKVIDFSVEPSQDNKTQEEFTSLRELGISLDIKQQNFPDILSQLKHVIKKSRSELENCKSELKNAEEQLCEFPALKEEVEELKNLLESTMATMETDKKFYENQLDNFTTNRKMLEQRLTELTQEVDDKSKDLHLLKEDILRRENMILELAKEKRNLTNKMAELEVKMNELQSRNTALENGESERRQMREKIQELEKLEQLVSEKNHQIDSLNQHLDRLDDLQRCLDDKSEELENLKEAFEEKSNELFQLQDTVEALNRDVARMNEDNNALNTANKELKLQLSKLEKEQENASLKLQNSEGEVERLSSLNGELTSKIEELKLLTDKLKDKETEIEILNEDINAFHEEIASLKEQLKMVSRSPSPRSKPGEDKKPMERRAGGDMKQLMKIRKQISLMQHELDFHKKELNDKAFELAKAKLDVTELKNNLGQANKLAADKELEADELRLQLQHLAAQKQQLGEQLEAVNGRIREESNVSELKSKLREKVERCQELEGELQDMKDLVERLRTAEPQVSERALVVSGSRSPTAELERALRDQLDYSHALDDDIMEQILSASSDEREDIPRLTLNTSNRSSSSAHSSSSDRMRRLRQENDKLQLQLSNLQLRLRDKDALIAELNRIRDKLTNEWQTSQLRCEAERDNAARLQLLLHTHKDTADSLQNQDSSMIQMLKKRLESAMQSEVELQQQLQQARGRIAQLQRQTTAGGDDSLRMQLQHELESNERLRGELSVLKSKLEVERTRVGDANAALEHWRLRTQRDIDAAKHAVSALQAELADAKRLKHEVGVELLRAKELLNIQSETIGELEKKLKSSAKQKPFADAVTEIESQKNELAREIAALRKLTAVTSPAPAPAPDRDQAVRYLHGRCLRLESCRKALVWQKRYLQRVLAGYAALERSLRPHHAPPTPPRRRFKCVALAVVVVLRMEFLVRRRHHVRALSAQCILRTSREDDLKNTSASNIGGSPAAGRARDLRIPLSGSPLIGDFVRRAPYNVSSPREEPFILSPRGEGAAFCKLQFVGRGLARDLP